MMKKCQSCLQTKDLIYFYSRKRKSGKIYYNLDCKECCISKSKKYYVYNNAFVIERARKYRKDNPEKVREQNLKWDKENRERRKDYAKSYRQTEMGRQKDRTKCRNRRAIRKKTYDGYLDLEIFDRDDWICWLCQSEIDCNLKYPHPMSASIDHVTLLSLGGGDNRNNVRASHLSCNIRRPRPRRAI